MRSTGELAPEQPPHSGRQSRDVKATSSPRPSQSPLKVWGKPLIVTDTNSRVFRYNTLKHCNYSSRDYCNYHNEDSSVEGPLISSKYFGRKETSPERIPFLTAYDGPDHDCVTKRIFAGGKPCSWWQGINPIYCVKYFLPFYFIVLFSRALTTWYLCLRF